MRQHLLVYSLGLGLASAVSAAPVVDLNNAGYVTYANVNSYSMPLNNIDIRSTPGAIKDQIVIYTGANGADVTTNAAGFDDAYGVPNGKQTPYASMGQTTGVTAPTAKGGINNNLANTWDANLLNLKGFLDGSTALFLFNNNDTNKDQTLAIWAKFWITDSSGGLYNNRYLYLSNLGSAYGLGGTPITPNDGNAPIWNADYGNVINPTTGFASTDFVAAGGNVLGENHNLGADRVAYAADVPLLNQWFDTLFGLGDGALDDYTFHLDLRMGCSSAAAWNGTCDMVQIDNGYEQLFLVANDRDRFVIPEPTALALTGLALVAMGATRRRQRVIRSEA